MGNRDEPSEWLLADGIFGDLLELPPTARRAALEAMDVAAPVRARVERMLDALQQDGDGILDQPERLAALLQVDALAGRRLGRWRLGSEIGRGGMSVVYRAESTEGPAGQAAAVKVLTLGTLADSGSRQFLREQDSLLRLRHPYIAPLFDAGVADDGTPWMAMALVDGTRIDAWCDGHGLDARGRVHLSLQVCEAVAHAHRNLVIHRDIKPSNVLVDDDGRVRLLDFGIARALDTDGEATTTALRALTPGYAAPEQAEGAPPATTMDVYGIGALLYRLLAGSPPPSGGDGHLRGDLGAVVGKALAADPERRYSNVEALSNDLGNWLAGRPVAARPPSFGYRARKFAVRNRLLLAVAAVAVLLLAGGIASTVHQMQRARDEATRALAAQARAEAAREEADAHRKYMSRVFAVLVPSREGDRELDRGKIVEQLAADAREQFPDRPALLSSVELDLGMIAQRLGQHPRAIELLTAALGRRVATYGPDHLLVAEAKAELGKTLRGGKDPDKARAETLLAEAVASFRALDAPAKVRIPALLVHAVALSEAGRNEEALADLAEAAGLCPDPAAGAPVDDADDALCERVLLSRATLASRSFRSTEALAALRPLYARRVARLGEGHASTLIAGTQLGEALLTAGKPEEAGSLLESVRERQMRVYPEDHGELVVSASLLARAYLGVGRVGDARELYEWVLVRGRAIGGNNTTMAHGLLEIGLLEHRDGNPARAEAHLLRAYDMFVALQGASSPAAVATLGYRADALREMGRLQDAEAMHLESLEGTRLAFGAQSPRVASRIANLARTRVLLGRAREALDDYDAALVLYRNAQEASPGETGAAAVLAWRTRALVALGEDRRALADARAAVAEMERLGATEQREYREAHALLTDVACRQQAADCARLRDASGRMANAPQLPGGARSLLRAAAEGVPLP